MKGPSELVGRSEKWILETYGEPCSKEPSSVGGVLWLYAQEQHTTELLDCGTPGVSRSLGIFLTNGVCTAAMSLDRPPE